MISLNHRQLNLQQTPELEANADAIAAGERPMCDYTGGSGFSSRGIGPGDRLYILNWFDGELRVLGRMIVAEVLDRQVALARGIDIYDAPEHILAAAGSGTPIVLDAAVSDDELDDLGFFGPNGSTVRPKRNPADQIEPQTFRGVREVDGDTEALFDDALGFADEQRFDRNSLPGREASVLVVLVDDDANEREQLVHLTVVDEALSHRNTLIEHSVANAALLSDDDRSRELVAALIRGWADRNRVQIDLTDLHDQLYPAVQASEPLTQPEAGPVVLKGSTPLLYPPAGSLPGKKGARTDRELTPAPSADELSPVSCAAQAELLRLVAEAGGREGHAVSTPIPTGDLDPLVALCEEWAEHYGTSVDGGLSFNGPGLWHALDRVVPLQNPNRWDRLRKAVTDELQARGWVRSGGPRGSKWWIPNRDI